PTGTGCHLTMVRRQLGRLYDTLKLGESDQGLATFRQPLAFNIPSIVLPIASAHIKLAPAFVILLAHLGHPRLSLFSRDERLYRLVLLRGKIPHFLRNLHRAELRAAHA